jgi:hypothetical protein
MSPSLFCTQPTSSLCCHYVLLCLCCLAALLSHLVLSGIQPTQRPKEQDFHPATHSKPTIWTIAFLRFSGGTMEWNTSDLALAYGLGSTDSVSLDEDLFLSKAFSNSMHPTKIIPYFYRATGSFEQDDITITTIITSNRFQVFSRLIEQYQGKLSLFRFLSFDTQIHVERYRTYIGHHSCTK